MSDYKGGNAIVISSQSGYYLPALTAAQDELLATAPAMTHLTFLLKTLPIPCMLTKFPRIPRWGKRKVRVNAIIMTPLSYHELNGERAQNYRDMLAKQVQLLWSPRFCIGHVPGKASLRVVTS
jgi:hypothetical protein